MEVRFIAIGRAGLLLSVLITLEVAFKHLAFGEPLTQGRKNLLDKQILQLQLSEDKQRKNRLFPYENPAWSPKKSPFDDYNWSNFYAE